MIYVLIPVFNRLELTKSCIASLNQQTIRSELSIIVVDDGSTDGTSEWLSSHCPDVTILNGTGSLFWGGAIRFGIEYILKIGNLDDYILLVNNDIELKISTIELLKDFMVKNNRGVVVGALTVDLLDRQSVIKSGTIVKNWFFNITEHLYAGDELSHVPLNNALNVDFLTGRCLLHPIEVFWQAGNYDAKLFMHYGCDDEFSMRVKRYGVRTFILPSAIVYMLLPKPIKIGFWNTLFSTRSSSNLSNKFKLSRRVAPFGAKTGFFLFGLIKSIVVATKNMLQK